MRLELSGKRTFWIDPRNSDRTYLYATDDFGATWRSIAGNLPDETIHVVWEDNRNPNLLFVRTGDGVVPVLDLAQSDAAVELVVRATLRSYGRLGDDVVTLEVGGRGGRCCSAINMVDFARADDG